MEKKKENGNKCTAPVIGQDEHCDGPSSDDALKTINELGDSFSDDNVEQAERYADVLRTINELGDSNS